LIAVTPGLTLIILIAGIVAGAFGATLGLGGGIFLVPFLNLVLGLPITVAAAISLTTVIATSSSVSAARAGQRLINLRLGMSLEVATAAGSLAGGITAQLLSEDTIRRLFAVMMAIIAILMLRTLNQRVTIAGTSIDPGLLGGQFDDPQSGGVVTYRVKRFPLALLASFVAGNVSSLLGLGGGVIKVPVLNAWCGIPLRAAAATSAFMIGVTATAGAIIYYGNGQLVPALAAAAVLGVQAGSWLGLRIGERASNKALKLVMAAVMIVVAVIMAVRGRA
jgi:uncharacterized membrane protein YfcA